MPGSLGRRGEERSVERAAESLGRGPRLGERGAQHLHAALQRTLRPQRRPGLLGVAELADDPAHGVGGGRAGVGNSGWIAEQILDLANDAERQPQAAGQQVAEHVAARLGRCRRAIVELGVIDRRRLGSVAFEVEELQRQLHAAFAVGDRVVQLLDQSRLAAAQAVDDDELPQRSGAIERIAGDEAGQVEQLTHRAGLRQGDVADVVAQVEVAVGDPRRRREVDRRRLHTLAESLDHVHGALHARQQPVEVGRAVENRDRGERAGQMRILLEPPHQALRIAHLAVELRRLGHEFTLSHDLRRVLQ